MKRFCQPVLYLALIYTATLLSCSKDTSELPQKIVFPEVLNGKWSSNQFEGISGDTLTFTISPTISGSVINKIVGFNQLTKAGDMYIFDIAALTTGDFYCILYYFFTSGNALYRYPRNAVISLQNNNTQMSVALVAEPGYPSATYVYQKVN